MAPRYSPEEVDSLDGKAIFDVVASRQGRYLDFSFYVEYIHHPLELRPLQLVATKVMHDKGIYHFPLTFTYI